MKGFVLFGFDQIHGFPIANDFWCRFVLTMQRMGFIEDRIEVRNMPR